MMLRVKASTMGGVLVRRAQALAGREYERGALAGIEILHPHHNRPAPGRQRGAVFHILTCAPGFTGQRAILGALIIHHSAACEAYGVNDLKFGAQEASIRAL